MSKGKAPGYHNEGTARPTIKVLPGVPSTRRAHVNTGANITHDYVPLVAQFPDILEQPQTAVHPPDEMPRPTIPPGLPPGIPPPVAEETFAGWFRDATKGKSIIQLKNPKNTTAFTEDDVRTSVKSACLLIDPDWKGEPTVTGFGTGPWQVAIDEGTAKELVEGEYLDIFSIEHEDKECEFTVDLCDPYGRPIRQTIEAEAAKAAAKVMGSHDQLRLEIKNILHQRHQSDHYV